MHMHTAIPVMKMKIIVQSGMKMVFTFLLDQILSSLYNLPERERERERLTECRRNGFRDRENERRKIRRGGGGSTALTLLLNT